MTPAGVDGRAAALAGRWVAHYTARVAPDLAERRRAELASDVWEQRAHGRAVGAAPAAVAASIVARVVGGMAADVVWSRRHRAPARGPSVEGEAPVMTVLANVTRRGYWLVGAAALVGFYVVVVAGNLAEPSGPYLAANMLCLYCAAAVLTGLALWRRHRDLGDVLVAAGVVPCLLVVWLWPVQVVAIVVLLSAAVDLVDVRATRTGARPGLVTALLGAAMTAMVVMWIAMMTGADRSAVAVAVLGTAVLVALLLVVIRRPRMVGRPSPG